MVEGRHRARLALESSQPLRARGYIGWKHLDRHVASEPRIAGAIDLSHSAGPQRGQDHVAA
jgi:hypothetical protein